MSKWQDILTTDGMLVKLINGLRAITVESYNSQNIQNGLQFYFRKAYPLTDPIASGTSRYIVFRTSSKKVLFKSRVVSYIGEEFRLELFNSPTLSDDGTPIIVSNYNGVYPQATTVEVYKGPTVVAEGTPIDDPNEPEYYFGSSSQGQRAANSIPEGRERILPENTTFLIKVTNTGTGNGRFQYFGDWYEGEPAIPNNDLI